MRRTSFSFFSLLALASILLASACSGNPAAKEQPTPTPLPTPVAASKPTYKVQKGDVTSQVQFSARIIPAIQEELFFRTSGRVRKVYVKSGDMVTKEQVLADLVSLDQMESQKKQQEMNLRRAQINYEMAWLRQQMAATQTPNWNGQYDIQMKMEQYQVELAQIALEETKLQSTNLDTSISDAQISAPIDGKVLSISVLEGTEAKEFTTMVTVGDDTQLEVGATLSTTQMQDLAEGMPVMIELPNRPGDKLAGKIRILPYPFGSGGSKEGSETAANATGKTTDTTARIAFDDPAIARSFKMGELVQATVILESKKGVLWLPPLAIRTFEGRNFVVVKTDGLPRRVDVKLGIKNDEKVEILDGVQEGQTVVAP